MAQSWYERNLLPYLLDIAFDAKPSRKQRAKVIPLARGRVLEFGIGTGLNMPFDDRSRVRRIVGVDPSMHMHRLALKRIRRAGIEVELVGLCAKALPIADASFDTVVSTYTPCARSRTPSRPSGRCAAFSSPAASSCSPNMDEHRMRTSSAG